MCLTSFLCSTSLNVRLILSWNLLKFAICARLGNLFPLLLRSSPPEVFCKKGVPRNFAKFIGTPMPESLL